jgi:hypothetical protein
MMMLRVELSLVLALICFAGCGQSSTKPTTQPSTDANSSTPASDHTLESSAPQADEQWAQVLAEVVTEEGLVHYERFKSAGLNSKLQQVVAGYAKTPLADHIDRRKALLCNAYNANVIAAIVRQQDIAPVESIQDTPGFLDQMNIVVAESQYTLNGLRDRLREFRDPRIHGSLVSGRRGDPPLAATPLTPHKLSEQLDSQSRRWVEKRVRVTGRGLALSDLFQMYEDDFKIQPYQGVMGFIRRHASTNSSIRDFMRSQSDVQLLYGPHDARLNQAMHDPAAAPEATEAAENQSHE